MPKPILFLFTHDLRIEDSPGLLAASQSGAPVIPVYIYDHSCEGRDIGGASQWWLYHSLQSLKVSIRSLGLELILRRGHTCIVMEKLCEQFKPGAVYWSKMFGSGVSLVEQPLIHMLKRQEIECRQFPGYLLCDPATIHTKVGGPYKVFTPYWRACRSNLDPGEPLPRPNTILSLQHDIASENIEDWNLLPRRIDWSSGLREFWQPGENNAHIQLERFVASGLQGYADGRNIPGKRGTSQLSPYLHFGEISPRQVWHRMQIEWASHSVSSSDIDTFLGEIGWREFSYYLLHHWPDLPVANFRKVFDKFPWESSNHHLAAWQKGKTGIPLIDAGMRELWHIGWMHNRLRMIVASFLVKNLMIHWREGEAWFWDTLVDADAASNAAGWQWVAGSGADAAPYFRIFNPVTQSQKFDPDGQYIRKWVPEISALPDKYLHCPWAAPEEVLNTAGVVLGETYPNPLVDLKISRAQALVAYRSSCH